MTVLNNIYLRFSSFIDVMETLDPQILTKQLDVSKSKSVGEHMWCLVGARESYARAIIVGHWDGFSCSLENSKDLNQIIEKLKTSGQVFKDAVDSVSDWTEERDNLLVHLLEHESMHEGQLIRHIFALEKDVPKSVKWA
ncbi:hypothetical protein [Veronia pacifica]|nr:hypothetical protein [Veronia pacifica]